MTRWLTLTIVLLNVLAGAILPSAPAFAPPGGQMVICTASGMVVLNPDGSPLGRENPPKHTEFCAFCLPLLHAGADAPAVVAISEPAPRPQPIAFPAAVNRIGALRRQTGSPGPRAPPIA